MGDRVRRDEKDGRKMLRRRVKGFDAGGEKKSIKGSGKRQARIKEAGMTGVA